MLIVSKSCVYPILTSLSVSLHNPFKIFDLVVVTKSMFRVSAVSAVGCPRLLNFRISMRTDFVRFTRPLESNYLTISERINFTLTSSMHDDSRFFSSVADP